MKKADFLKIVAEQVEENGAENVKAQDVAVALISQGCSPAMVTRELNKALKSHGVAVAANSNASAVQELRKELESALDGVDGNYWSDHADFTKWIAELETEGVSEKRVLKEVKAFCKENDITVPTKVKLGAVKTAILNLFVEQDGNVTLKELTDELFDTYATMNKEAIEKDSTVKKLTADELSAKSLRTARMEYSFLKAMWDHKAV